MTPEAADRASRFAAVTLALSLPADTVIYLLLPLHAALYGLSLPEVGILLAANRLVRIAGYGHVARFYASRGSRAACMVAAAAASLAIFGNATLYGFWPLLAARLLWGLAFAALNIATQALPTAIVEGAARRSGRARAIVAVGPMLGLLGGAIMAEMVGPRPVFLLLAVISLPAILFASRLPPEPEPIQVGSPRIALPSPMDVWSFCMGFTVDGLFVIGLALLAAESLPQGATIAAGAALSLRYAAEVVLTPAGGALAQRVGARRLLVALSLAVSAALALLGTGGILLWIGALATVVLRALIQPLPGPVIAEANPGPGRVPALARQSTWRDVGGAAGPLLAGVLLPVVPALALYGIAAVLLATASAAVGRERPR